MNGFTRAINTLRTTLCAFSQKADLKSTLQKANGLESALIPKSSFYHFHGDPNQMITVPSPKSADLLKIMPHNLNHFMEQRIITDKERKLHRILRHERALVLEQAGHTVKHLDFPNHFTLKDWLAPVFVPQHLKTFTQQWCQSHHLLDPSGKLDGDRFLKQRDTLIAQLAQESTLSATEKEQVDTLITAVACNLPDWMFFANTLGLNLSISPKLDDTPIRLLPHFRFLERQPELRASLQHCIDSGALPVVAKTADEGRADWGETNIPGLWMGIQSSRTDPHLYDNIMKLTQALTTEDGPKELVRVEIKKSHPGYPDCDLQRVFYHKDLVASYIPGTEEQPSAVALVTDAVTPESIARLEKQGVNIVPIPIEEGFKHALNTVVVWGEAHGGAPSTDSIAIMPTDCPTMCTALEQRGFAVKEMNFGSQTGGGNWECETAYELDGHPPLKAPELKSLGDRGNALLEEHNLAEHFKFLTSTEPDELAKHLST